MSAGETWQVRIKMRLLLIILLFFTSMVAAARQQAKVLERMNRLHQLMTEGSFYIDRYIDDSLSYGHSNGWVENKEEFLKNLGSRIIYHSIKEDSIRVVANRSVAHIRFVADIDVTLDGKRNVFRLKVLEVWGRKKKSWLLFARHAVKG